MKLSSTTAHTAVEPQIGLFLYIIPPKGKEPSLRLHLRPHFVFINLLSSFAFVKVEPKSFIQKELKA